MSGGGSQEPRFVDAQGYAPPMRSGSSTAGRARDSNTAHAVILALPKARATSAVERSSATAAPMRREIYPRAAGSARPTGRWVSSAHGLAGSARPTGRWVSSAHGLAGSARPGGDSLGQLGQGGHLAVGVGAAPPPLVPRQHHRAVRRPRGLAPSSDAGPWTRPACRSPNSPSALVVSRSGPRSLRLTPPPLAPRTPACRRARRRVATLSSTTSLHFLQSSEAARMPRPLAAVVDRLWGGEPRGLR